MKFDNHLASYLYQIKSLTLEGIGTFTLDDKVRVPNEQEKEVYFPIEGLAFTYNPKTNTDENIIFFLVKKLGKIEPLIRSDLEYYLSHIKQFLNIGNPYTIEGIGTLNKNNQGIYEFTPGNFLPAKEELHPKRQNADHNYPVRSQNPAGRTFIIILLVIISLAAVGAIGWGIFNYIEKPRPLAETSQPQGYIDTIPQKKDTSTTGRNIQPLTSDPVETANPITNVNNLTDYKMIFEITKSKERANSRIKQLNSLHSNAQYDSIPINDSVAFYRLFLEMKINAADSIHIKDSLNTFFGKKIYMEKQVD